MNMQRFYKTYNLGRERFASLFGSSVQSVIKYEKGDPTLRLKTKARIEKAIRVIKKYKLIHPKPEHNFTPMFCGLYSYKNERQHVRYVEKFKELYEREEES